MKDFTNNSKSVFTNIGASNHSETERQRDDYYATSPNTLRIFLDKLKEDGIEFNKTIVECAVGGGHLAEVLKEHGYSVIGIDRKYRGYQDTVIADYLNFKLNIDKDFDILTNPPFKYAEQFLEKAMGDVEEGNKVAFLLKLQFLEGKKRFLLFKKYLPKYVYINSTRQHCAINGEFGAKYSSAMCYCWYIWEKGFTGEPIIRWIKGF